MKEALYYQKQGEDGVLCLLCPHQCRIPQGKTGRCGVRRNRGGTLWGESYGKITGLALDSVEKKPLAHFRQGGMVLSAGSWGCSLRCPFCQNHHIAMGRPHCREMTPEELTAAALSLTGRGNIGLAFTYNEPLVGYEYVLDCAKAARAQGLETVLVTNGFVEEAPLLELLPWVSAANIDLKAFREETYRWLGGELEPVRRSIELAAARCHLEVTALIVPGRNDSPGEMDAMAGWLASIHRDIPLHVTRYFPSHRMEDIPPTPVETVHHLAQVARGHLRRVSTGNC